MKHIILGVTLYGLCAGVWLGYLMGMCDERDNSNVRFWQLTVFSLGALIGAYFLCKGA